ncbi:MAG: hypothetical protein HY905_21770 [Deltaproteobacteria bacterium]|nr:hypothetical protein [Deltaproteobacteria bacterium]
MTVARGNGAGTRCRGTRRLPVVAGWLLAAACGCGSPGGHETPCGPAPSVCAVCGGEPAVCDAEPGARPAWCDLVCSCRGCDRCVRQPGGSWAWEWVSADCVATPPDGGLDGEADARDDGDATRPDRTEDATEARDGDEGGWDEGEVRDDGDADRAEDVRTDGDARPVCGDGRLDAGEECDDGNDESGDGCEPLTCRFSCGASAECDDGDPCTADDCETVALGRRCGHEFVVGAPCDDGDACTIGETCDAAGSCRGGVDSCECRTDADCGDPSPWNPCDALRVCSPLGACVLDPGTAADPGTPCDDGLFCNGTEKCDDASPGSRRCRSFDPPCLACESCDETTHACTLASGCLIDGACYDVVATNPDNDCLWCFPPTTATDWTDVPDPVTCDDGDPCTVGETCAAGVCVAPPQGDEVCDGEDNDCDRLCDEDWTCCVGSAGACRTARGTSGFRRCTPACGWADCSLERVCAGDWCWSNPLPQGNNLYGVWGSAADDVWFVGGVGVILHWDGTTMSAVPSGTAQSLYGVWGSSADDVWAVGDGGTILHRTAGTWTLVPIGTTAALHGIWGTSAADVWAVGDSGTILHWNGTSWSPVPSGVTGHLSAVWASGPADAWAVGSSRTVVHWDGTSWTPDPAWVDGMPMGVWGSGPTDVWVVGLMSAGSTPLSARHWDGASWTDVPGTGLVPYAMSVWGTSATDVWTAYVVASFEHWDGASWTSVSTGLSELAGVSVLDLWGSDPSDLWAVASRGRILHWNGTAWAEVSIGPIGSATSVWSAGPADAWASVYGGFLRWDGGSWTSFPTSFFDVWNDVWGAAPDDVWAVGYATGVGAPPRPIAAHWNGVSWRSAFVMPFDGQLTAICGSGAADVWAVGTGGNIVHMAGGWFWPVASGVTVDLEDVWCRAGDDVWAVGARGTVLRWDGAAWTSSSIGSSRQLHGVGGFGPSNVWIVGASDTILHWTGGPFWTYVATGTECTPRKIWSAGPTDLWIVGDVPSGASASAGMILHGDGLSWTASPPLAFVGLVGVAGSGLGDVWAAGPAGILRHEP